MKVYLLNLDYFYEDIEQNEYYTEVYSSLEKAVEDVLADGYRTSDIMEDGKKHLSCSEMGDKIVEYLNKA